MSNLDRERRSTIAGSIQPHPRQSVGGATLKASIFTDEVDGNVTKADESWRLARRIIRNAGSEHDGSAEPGRRNQRNLQVFQEE